MQWFLANSTQRKTVKNHQFPLDFLFVDWPLVNACWVHGTTVSCGPNYCFWPFLGIFRGVVTIDWMFCRKSNYKNWKSKIKACIWFCVGRTTFLRGRVGRTIVRKAAHCARSPFFLIAIGNLSYVDGLSLFLGPTMRRWSSGKQGHRRKVRILLGIAEWHLLTSR